MNPKLIVLFAVVLAVTACKGRFGDLRRDQQNYEVVEEGNASGVAATLNAPGEPPPAMPSLTGTNADTTSAFTLSGGMTTTDTTAGTLAGTLPSDRSGGMPYGYPSDAPVRPRPRPAPAPVTPVEPPVTTTTTAETTTTTAEPVPQPAPAPAPEPEQQEEPEEPEPQPPTPPTTTDTSGTTTTDTSGDVIPSGARDPGDGPLD